VNDACRTQHTRPDRLSRTHAWQQFVPVQSHPGDYEDEHVLSPTIFGGHVFPRVDSPITFGRHPIGEDRSSDHDIDVRVRPCDRNTVTRPIGSYDALGTVGVAHLVEGDARLFP
jgi:hypothetical protein